MSTGQTENSPKAHAGHKTIEGTLSKSLLEFNLANEIDRLRQDESWNQASGRSSETLVKYPDLRIVLIAMKANTRMHEHTAAARISVQTLSGRIKLHLPSEPVDLPAGHLLALDECVSHDVEATEDSVFLLTLSWPRGSNDDQTQTSGGRK